MALAGRMRSIIPHFNQLLKSESQTQRTALLRSLLCPTNSVVSRNYSTASTKNEEKVKVPLALFGGSGNYASALYLAAVKANVLDKVETELLDLVAASQRSATFSQFTRDLSVPADTRVKAINDISAAAKFSEVIKNFLVVLAENGRLRYIDSIAKRFLELTMAHRGEVKAIVTTVIPLPPEEEKELKETLQDIIGQGKKVKLEQKIDPSILGGLVVEFGEKVFDMSIKTRARQMERFLREPANLDSL
ncbi:ATP synthase subunit O, mitochondrial-like isoform X2 [Momordica charantia]|uniref:ATP synthase subunit O, mitochondrial-like isoform X2 n=1 Tax=Momordica charantia TaxID=3673 RepID=A0A6J1D685_MOMCH|nr:ATP synthase subunit O, mitochondrial-like isoform X2 [Momordica charantia]